MVLPFVPETNQAHVYTPSEIELHPHSRSLRFDACPRRLVTVEGVSQGMSSMRCGSVKMLHRDLAISPIHGPHITDEVIHPQRFCFVRCTKCLQRRHKAVISSRIEKRGFGVPFQGAKIRIIPLRGNLRRDDALPSVEVEQLGAGAGM
jgi:hypothetical protein